MASYDASGDVGLTVEHFYSLLSKSIGLDDANRLQLATPAIWMPLSKTNKWYSQGLINNYLDRQIARGMVGAVNLSVQPARLSSAYLGLISLLKKQVAFVKLDPALRRSVEALETESANLGELIASLEKEIEAKWISYAKVQGMAEDDYLAKRHWLANEADNRTLRDRRLRRNEIVAEISGLLSQNLSDPADREIINAWLAATSPAAKLAYPAAPDSTFTDAEEARFSLAYLAGLVSDGSSGAFRVYYQCNNIDIEQFVDSSFGAFSDSIRNVDIQNSSFEKSWSGGLGVGYGVFSLDAGTSGSEKFKDDMKHVTDVKMSCKFAIALESDFSMWLNQDMLKHRKISEDFPAFESYLGKDGGLRFLPRYAVFVKGLSIEISTDQDLQYEYKKHIEVAGSAGVSFFGIRFGGSAGYTEDRKTQRVTQDARTVTFSDGDNIRLVGYVVNEVFGPERDYLERVEAKQKEFYLRGATRMHALKELEVRL